MMALPEGPFKTILADPAWPYDQATARGGVAAEYRTMTIPALCKLPVRRMADKDAILLMWCTNPHLPNGLKVGKAWGFTYKTKLPWVKNTVGVGQWLRGCTEDLLLFTRGRPPLPENVPKGVLFADNPGHSQKPRSQYVLAEQLGHGPRAELFARQRRAGWTAWGDQLSGTIETPLAIGKGWPGTFGVVQA